MARKPHPKFPNSTIAEALCEIQVRPAEDSKWRISRPAELLSRLGDEFPEFEPLSNTEIQVQVGPTGPTQQLVQRPARLRFSTEDKKRFVQATDTVFTFNFIDPYPGWDAVRQSVLQNWEKVRSVVKPKEVVRIGLRYINKIPRTEEHPHLRDWLKPTRHLPPAVIESADPFLARIEARPDAGHLMIVTLAAEKAAPPAPHSAIVFDIDRAALKSIAADNATIEGVLETLHDDAWDEFDTAMTAQLKAFLERARQ